VKFDDRSEVDAGAATVELVLVELVVDETAAVDDALYDVRFQAGQADEFHEPQDIFQDEEFHEGQVILYDVALYDVVLDGVVVALTTSAVVEVAAAVEVVEAVKFEVSLNGGKVVFQLGHHEEFPHAEEFHVDEFQVGHALELYDV
jgi:hypothetical protein